MINLRVLKKILFIYFQREGKGGRGKEILMCGCLSHTPNGGPSRNLGMCPDWESNWPSHTSQGKFMLF